MSASIRKPFSRSFLASTALVLSRTALAQSPIESYTQGGVTYSYTQADNSSVAMARDDTGQSPDRVITHNLDPLLGGTNINGPRTDIDDLYTVSWSQDNRVKTVANPLGHVASWVYDEDFRLTQAVNVNGAKTGFDYNDLGQVLRITRGVGSGTELITTLSYNESGLVTQVSRSNGEVLSGLVDDSGAAYTRYGQNLLSEVYAPLRDESLEGLTKHETSKDRQRLARLIANEYADSTILRDDKGRIASAQNLDGGVVNFAYDEFDNLIEAVDPAGVMTQYRYDGFGQVTEEISAERGTTKYKYDAAGNLTESRHAGGMIIKRDYDALNRITREVFKERGVDRKVNRYRYDNCENGIGRICRVSSNGHVTRYDYNVFGQYTKVASRNNGASDFDVIRYDYGPAGRLTTVHYPTDLKVRYHYRQGQNISRVTGWYGETGDKEKFTLARNIKIDPASGQLLGLTYGNGLKANYGYTDEGLVDKIALRQDGALLDRRNYSYDSSRNVTAITRPEAAKSQSFTYDVMGRVTGEQRGTNNPVAYNYDQAGNRLSRDTGSRVANYAYGSASNQITSMNGKAISFDARGNLVSDRRGKRVFTYDVTNRMTEFFKDGELKARYAYNAFGQRVSKVTMRPMTAADDHKSLSFTYMPGGQLLSEIGYKSDNSHAFTHEYIWLGGVPLAKLSRKIRDDGTTG